MPAVERVSAAVLLARREASLDQKKAAIADLASSLVEAPEDNVRLHSNYYPPSDLACMSLQISNAQRLLVFCCEREPQVACTVRRLAMASLATVFKDIAPRYLKTTMITRSLDFCLSYHIRELTEEEKATKVCILWCRMSVFCGV